MSCQCISASGLLVRFGQSFGPEDLEPPKLPSRRSFKLRKQLQAGGFARGEALSEAEAVDNNLPESKNDPNLVAAIRRWLKSGVSGVITADGVPSEHQYIFTDRRVQSVLGLAVVAGGYFYWTHESLRLPTADEAAIM